MVFGTLTNANLNTNLNTNSQTQKLIEISPPQEDVIEVLTNEEPLLQESNSEYVIFPIQHDDMWRMYKSLVDNFWSVTENIDLFVLNENEKQFLKIFSSFYASSNSFGLVNENFVEEFSKLVQICEAKFFYGHQLFTQNIHFEMYNKLLQTLMKNEGEINETSAFVEGLEAVKRKRQWATVQANLNFSDKLVASACLHGLFFTSLVVLQDWLRIRSLRETTSHELVEFIDRMNVDLELERDFACLMVSHLKQKPSKELIVKLIDECIGIEFAFLIEVLKVNLISFNENYVRQLLDKNAAILRVKLLRAIDRKVDKIEDKENEKVEFNNEHRINCQKMFDHDF